jgi:hypothetical protein
VKRIFFPLLILFYFLTPNNLLGQEAGFNFTLGFPQGEFKNNVKRTGFGVSGDFLFISPQAENPVAFGINIGFLNYGSESRLEPFSSTIPEITVNVDRSNNIVNFHVLFQIAPQTGIVRPYFETLFGGSYIFTETSIKSRGTEEVASSTNFDDFAWSYGVGGGLLFQVYSTDDPDKDVSSVLIDAKVRYLFGSEAEYLKEGSVIINNGSVSYNVSKSKTDLLTAHIGVVLYFSHLW